MPFERSRNWWPDWVPAGTVTRVRPPSTVGTSIVPPRAAVALEDPVRCHADEDEQIARRSTADADLAFSGKPHADAVLDPGGDVDRQRLFAPRAALAAARLARIVDDPPGTLAAGAGLLEREKTLLHAQLPAAVAPRAGDRLGARFGAAALALVAGDQCRHADRRLLAAERLLERDLKVIAQVVATARPTLATPAAHDLAKHLLEDVGKAAGAEAETTRTGAAALFEGGMTKAVIGGALLIVFEDVVSFVDILEFLLGALVPGITIGVVLHCELAIGPLELVGAC